LKNGSGLRPAYAGLGIRTSYFHTLPPTEACKQVAALKALERDDSLAEGHAFTAKVEDNYVWDWASAAREYEKADRTQSDYATLQWLHAAARRKTCGRNARLNRGYSLIDPTICGAPILFRSTFERSNNVTQLKWTLVFFQRIIDWEEFICKSVCIRRLFTEYQTTVNFRA